MSARTLDTPDVEALKARVAEAKSRGWQQSHLKRYFEGVGIQYPDYVAATTGKEVPRPIADELAAIAVVGLPKWPFSPNADDIRKHIDWLVKPALGAYDDALIEIAHDGPDGRLTGANLFGLDQIDEAVAFAVARNKDARNVYIGAALRLPDADRKKRSSGEDFYVATAVPIDIDTDYDATRANMAAICDDGLVVTTGLTPSRRSQHWARLLEPCESELEFGHAFRALVECVGADMKVKDAARVMRLAGTIAFPSARKIGAGYCMELTVASVNDAAKPSDIETLKALSPQEAPTERRDYSHRPQNDGIEREGILGTGKVVDGRERFFATKLLPRAIREYQDAHGCDPDADELFEVAFAKFVEEADNTDQRWTSPEGRKELRARAANTLRRLRIGRMARIGLASIDTGIGREEAAAAQAAWDETRKAQEPPQGAREPEGSYPPPEGPFRASDLTGEPPERVWVVDDWIVAGAVNSLYGDGGLGKTLLAQQLACSVATGVPWLGIPVKQGSVLAILCEDEKDELHRRHNAIKAAMGHTIGNPFNDVWLWPRVGDDNALIRWDKDSKPVVGAFWERIEQQIETVQPSLLILDTLADFYAGSEIDRPQVNYFVKTLLGGLIKRQAAKGHSLTILLLGHPSVAGKASGSGYSGSTAWNNAVRSRIYLTRPEEGSTDDRMLTRGKANYAKSGDETAIRLFFDQGVLHPCDDAEDGDSVLFAAREEACALVDKAWASGRPYAGRKEHPRYIFKALPADMMKAGFSPSVSRQALRELITDDAVISLAKGRDKRGYRTSRSGE